MNIKKWGKLVADQNKYFTEHQLDDMDTRSKGAVVRNSIYWKEDRHVREGNWNEGL
jgi:hypothetical protein